MCWLLIVFSLTALLGAAMGNQGQGVPSDHQQVMPCKENPLVQRVS